MCLGAVPELIAKWISGHGMPSSYLCLTSVGVDVAVTEQGSSAQSHRASMSMCRSLSVTSNPISSESVTSNLTYSVTAIFVKRLALCYQTVVGLSLCPVLSCPVCDVGVLLPNGWMDQYETSHAGRPRPWPHCAVWGPRSPSQRDTAPNFCPISVAVKWLHGSRCHLVWT